MSNAHGKGPLDCAELAFGRAYHATGVRFGIPRLTEPMQHINEIARLSSLREPW